MVRCPSALEARAGDRVRSGPWPRLGVDRVEDIGGAADRKVQSNVEKA